MAANREEPLMFRKILLIVPSSKSQFKVYRYFFKGLIDSFNRLGVECKSIEGDGKNPGKLYEEITSNPPDCTMCFNGFAPDEEGKFFCDEIQIPHIACLLDPPTRFFTLLKSRYTIVTCIDHFFCDFYRQLQPPSLQSQVLFFPHAVGDDLHVKAESPRKYDIVAMAICYDFEGDRKKWKERYSKEVCQIMEKTVEITFAEPYTSFIHAFMRSLPQESHLSASDWQNICYDLETYIKGKDRVDLIKAIQKENTVHIFGGSQKGVVGWDKYFPKGKFNVILHNAISLDQVVEVMKESKIVLNACPTVKDGSHERIFLGLACGALVCTSQNRYIEDQFKEDEGVIFFPFSDRKSINAKINHYLSHETARCEAVNKGYAIVKKEHTWDSRVKMLQERLPPLLDQLR